MNTTDRRVASVASAVLAVSLFLTVAVINVPHHATDAELVRWWQDSANRWSGVWSALSALVVAVSVVILRLHLERLTRGTESRWMSFGLAMTGPVAALWLVTGAMRGTVGHMVDVLGWPLPGPDVLRALTAVNYMLLGLSGMAGLALMILGVSVGVLRTGTLRRWVGLVGVGSAGVMLAATLAQYGAYTTPLAILWGLCLAVALWRTPTPAPGDAQSAEPALAAAVPEGR